jgi:hypothetical protein
MAATLKVRPADLTRISARHGGTFPLMRIEQIISGEEEVRGHGPMPCGGRSFHRLTGIKIWDEFVSTTSRVI